MNNNNEKKESKIIHLNIGGIRYTTTEGTLCHYGSNYFSGLLSGQFPALLDEFGAFFIDRNGTYFEPILDFLRSGELQVPTNMPRQRILQEAKFYLIDQIIKILTEEEEEEVRKLHREECVRQDGFYADDVNQVAITFNKDALKVVVAIGRKYLENIEIFHQVRDVPQLWKSNDVLSLAYAGFVHDNIKRGKYWEEGSKLVLMLSQKNGSDSGDSIYGVVSRGGNILYLSSNVRYGQGYGDHYKYEFHPWE